MRPGFFWMGGMWIFLIMIFGAIALVLFSIFGKNGKHPFDRFSNRKSALDILKERYARGEITKDEFEQLKKDILD